MYDLTVVGAGPVGSFLAWKFSEQGKNVLLLEKNVVGKPLKCTGHISKELFNFIPKNDEIIENRIKRGVFHNDGKEYVFGDDELKSYVIDRTKMDRFITQKARNSGVDFKTEAFRSMRRGDKETLVITEDGSYETKILAGCDGPLSDVRNSANLPDPKNFLQGIFTKVKAERKMKDEVDIYLGASRDFFGWGVPRNGEVEYGLATSLGNNVKRLFQRFSDDIGFKIDEIYSGLIPISPPRKTASKGIFLCGDAAAQVKPFTGGGVIYGLTSALIASKTIDTDKPETTELYERAWRNKLGREIVLGNQIRKVYGLHPKIRSLVLNLGERISKRAQMDKPSTLFRLP